MEIKENLGLKGLPTATTIVQELDDYDFWKTQGTAEVMINPSRNSTYFTFYRQDDILYLVTGFVNMPQEEYDFRKTTGDYIKVFFPDEEQETGKLVILPNYKSEDLTYGAIFELEFRDLSADPSEVARQYLNSRCNDLDRPTPQLYSEDEELADEFRKEVYREVVREINPFFVADKESSMLGGHEMDIVNDFRESGWYCDKSEPIIEDNIAHDNDWKNAGQSKLPAPNPNYCN